LAQIEAAAPQTASGTFPVCATRRTSAVSVVPGQSVASLAWKPILEAVRRLPSARIAALSTVLPIQHPIELLTTVYATEWTKGDVSATVRAATPELTDALGIPMHGSRFFTDYDSATTLPVMVVNRAFVNCYLGGGEAVGKTIEENVAIPRPASFELH